MGLADELHVGRVPEVVRPAAPSLAISSTPLPCALRIAVARASSSAVTG
jgi:hypothetical protein